MKSETPRLVLVVDDHEANRDVLSRRLRRHGVTVARAEDGRQALEMVREQPFDLILLDIMMPEMNGYQVLEQLKSNPTYAHIPVIMISAVDDLESVVRCIELGAEDYLFKPFNPVLLRARVGASLEKKRLRDQERAYVQAVRQELELGRRTQADFFPPVLPHLPGWDITALFQPAREVAGDFYDVFVLPDQRLGLVLADVCDKGVRAALFMVLVRSLMRAFAEQATSADAALQAVRLTSSYITRHHHHEGSNLHMFATLFFGLLEPASGQLVYINGGHDPPVLLRADGPRELLEPTGPAVGLMPDSHFSAAEVTLKRGDMLLAYTDGVTEARVGRGELFGEERLLELFAQPAESARALVERVRSAVWSHMGDESVLADDMTLLALEWLAQPD